ncbi:amidase [Novosphingobium flavum]|uniref:Amidase n=1 Tax=Novosphingobium aerophilum TaxID=2839843 RepID=A0A7X1F4F5_9SPHN|nr:amidase family protein [Novosphingobium aerophilum]MBC2650222.1 amidase [Novosphingobium aerophilum]MBC2660183.1 amidase [Novosphingobium aerophilum]
MATRREVIAGAAAGAAAMATGTTGAARAAPATTGLLDAHDALGLADLVRRRKVSPAELIDAAIGRAEALNPRYNFMAQVLYDRARKAVSAGLPDGPFRGVPWLIKDLNTHIAGELSEGGSRFYKGNRAAVSSELVRRIEAAGFVIFGKTTTPEFGLTPTTENKLNGDTRNPWNPAHTTGGSSGGAAAAVAAGVLPAAHATDGGGSIRIPAACCGLFGLKPSRGRVPMGPGRTEGWGGLSAHHAVTRSVRDSAAILDATCGVEPGSRYGAPGPEGSFLAQVGKAPGALRIALMVTPFTGSPVDPAVAEATRAAARLCESLGHHVEEAAPTFDMAALGFASFAIIGASVAADVTDRAKATGLDPAQLLEPITQGFVEYGKRFTAMDYARANNTFQQAATTMAGFLTRYDVILCPTLAAPPLPLGRVNLTPDCDFETWGRRAAGFAPYTQIANFTGQPAMSLPLAMSPDGLPIGIQFLGRYGEEALLFRLAGQIERAAPWAGRRAPIA